MKRYYIKVLAFSLCFILLFSSFVYADSNDSSVIYDNKQYFSMHDASECFSLLIDDIFGIADDYAGIIPGSTGQFQENFREFLQNHNITPDWLARNFLVDDPDKSPDKMEFYLSDDLLDLINDFVEAYKADCDADQVFNWKVVGRPSDYLQASSFQGLSEYNSCLSHLNGLCNQYDYIYSQTIGTTTSKVAYVVSVGFSVSQCVVVNEYIKPDFKSSMTGILDVTLDPQPDYKVYFFDACRSRNYVFSNWKEFSEAQPTWNMNTYGSSGTNSPGYYFTTSDGGSCYGTLQNDLWSGYKIQFLGDPLRTSYGSNICCNNRFIFAKTQSYFRSFKDMASALDYFAGNNLPRSCLDGYSALEVMRAFI